MDLIDNQSKEDSNSIKIELFPNLKKVVEVRDLGFVKIR